MSVLATCRYCGGSIPKNTQFKYYCKNECRQKYWNRHPERVKKGYNERLKPRGRICKHCKARDDETSFLRLDVCGVCDRLKTTQGTCETCGKINNGWLGYPDCFHCNGPPYGWIEIHLYEAKGRKRRRTIFRKMKEGCVFFGGDSYHVKTVPAAYYLPTHLYIKIRR
jgi:hypothetical protein